MIIERVDHIAINTKNINESIEYYGRVFGFNEVFRADMGVCELVYLKVNENTTLELFDLRGACEEGAVSESRMGLRHIAFQVDDINAWNKRLKECGGTFTMELTRMENIRSEGLLVCDPNGVIIELCKGY